MGLVAFIKQCFSRSRRRNQSHSISHSLLADERFSDSKRAEPSINSSSGTEITIKDIPTHFKVAQNHLTAAVHSIEHHIRRKQIYGRHLPVSLLMVGMSWFISRLILIHQTVNELKPKVDLQQNLYQTTWVNYSYPIPRDGSVFLYPEEPLPWLRASDNSTCEQASYPFNITDSFNATNGAMHWSYRRGPMINIDCWYYKSRTYNNKILDFRSTIGFALCEHIIDSFCIAQKELNNAQDQEANDIPLLGLCVAAILLSACIYYFPLTTLCIPMNPNRAKSVYDIAKYYDISSITEENFTYYLEYKPKELLKLYKQGMDNYLNNYLSRSAFIYGIKWHHSSTLKTLVDDPLYDKNILKFILEFAGLDNGHFHTKLIKPAAAPIENEPSSIPERTTESSALNIYRFLGGTPPNIQLEEETTLVPSL